MLPILFEYVAEMIYFLGGGGAEGEGPARTTKDRNRKGTGGGGGGGRKLNSMVSMQDIECNLLQVLWG